MNWITIAWPMVAAACLTLGLIELRIGLARPLDAARLLFSLSAFACAVVCGLELAMIRADSPAEFQALLRGLDVAAGVMITSLAVFIWVYFRSGRWWLALAGPGLYAVALVFDFIPGSSLGYLKITGLRTIETFGGASYHVLEGVPNPWNILTYLGVLMLLVFVVDASVRLWRRGGRQRAAVIGGSVAFWVMAAGAHSALIESGIVRMPYLVSLTYLVILLAMAYELTADVSAAARLARQLQESERRINLASRAARLSMWIWEVARDRVWSTPQVRKEHGGLPQEAPIDFAQVRAAVHPADRDAFDRAVQHALDEGEELDIEYRVVNPHGETRWMAARGRAEEADPERLMGVAMDITARKLAELQAEQDRAALRHMARVSMMGQLSASIAHQLNQPLAAILGNAEAARKMLGRDKFDVAELQNICDDIVTEDNRAAEVIRRLGALYKRGDMTLTSLDLNQLVRETLELVHIELVTRHVETVTELASPLPAIEGGPIQLQQVILNLILNAADAMNGIELSRRRILIRTEPADANVRLCVVDRGVGIAPGDQDKVFDAFWSSKPEGMGIGLTICQSIVAAHRGRITATNNAEGGATFCVSLPIRQSPSWRAQ